MSALELGALASATSRAVVGQAFRSWLSRDKPRAIDLTYDGDQITLLAMSDTDRQRLVEEFLRRHSDAATSQDMGPQSPPSDRPLIEHSAPEATLENDPSERSQQPSSSPVRPRAPGPSRSEAAPAPAAPSPVAPELLDQRTKVVDNVGQAVSVVATYIPSEALAAYIAITAILAPATLASRGTAMFLAIALNIVFVLAGYAYGQQSNMTPGGAAHSRRAKLRAIGVATWALLAYAAAMPDGFLTSFDWYKLQYGGVVALVSAILLPVVAPVSPAARVRLAQS